MWEFAFVLFLCCPLLYLAIDKVDSSANNPINNASVIDLQSILTTGTAVAELPPSRALLGCTETSATTRIELWAGRSETSHVRISISKWRVVIVNGL